MVVVVRRSRTALEAVVMVVAVVGRERRTRHSSPERQGSHSRPHQARVLRPAGAATEQQLRCCRARRPPRRVRVH